MEPEGLDINGNIQGFILGKEGGMGGWGGTEIINTPRNLKLI